MRSRSGSAAASTPSCWAAGGAQPDRSARPSTRLPARDPFVVSSELLSSRAPRPRRRVRRARDRALTSDTPPSARAGSVGRCRPPSGRPITRRSAPPLITERRDRADMIDATESAEPIDRNDRAEPIEPIDSTEPTDPTDRNDPRHPMQSTESSDHSDHFDVMPVTLSKAPGRRKGRRVGGCCIHCAVSTPGVTGDAGRGARWHGFSHWQRGARSSC